MTELEEQITKLTGIWCRFVGVDHHKDRDCHWYITQYYSYGEKPFFKARHHGYVADDFEGTMCTTIEEAQEELRDTILLEMHKAKEWVERNYKESLELAPEDRWTDLDMYKAMLDILNEGLEFGANKK